jgi:hypothetical protein
MERTKMKPWEITAPPILYKYLHPQRAHVLADCRVRFSQRAVFEDERELQPGYAAFGTEDEIWRFVISRGVQLDPRIPSNVLVKLIAENPRHQERAKEVAEQNIKSIHQLGIFCLTEAPDNERMWAEYADTSRGFVLAFDTTHPSFNRLKAPGTFGKVEYNDEPFGTVLGALEREGASGLFRKRNKYSFEAEWRSIRLLSALEKFPGDIYLSGFDPTSLREIIMRDKCSAATTIRQIVENDPRYKHVVLTVQEPHNKT